MCKLCIIKKGRKDIWKMREWYWKNRSIKIFIRGCFYVETNTWAHVLEDIRSLRRRRHRRHHRRVNELI